MATLVRGLFALGLFCACAPAAAAASTTPRLKRGLGRVSFDARSFIFEDGFGHRERKLIRAGSFHYPRASPEEWPSIFRAMREGGLNAVETLIMWNVHSPTKPDGGEPQLDRHPYNVTLFLEQAKKEGLYAIVRIGPYICAEWELGGIPWWLHDLEKTSHGVSAIRTNDTTWEKLSDTFVTAVIRHLHAKDLLFSEGGPVIMLQIENEYGNIESSYGEAGVRYVQHLGSTVNRLNRAFSLRIPWIMCQQPNDVPSGIVNTCNGFYCDEFEPSRSDSPKGWTEVWSGWFTAWGQPRPARPARDTAFAIARFVANGGSFFNYYMYYGGTNTMGRSGGPGIITSYDYDAPLDEYGFKRPKYYSLKALHFSLERASHATFKASRPQPRTLPLGSLNVTLMLYRTEGTDSCAAYIINAATKPSDTAILSKAQWNRILQNESMNQIETEDVVAIPPWSVTVLPDCDFDKAYNTADRVSSSASKLSGDDTSITHSAIPTRWVCSNEPIGVPNSTKDSSVVHSDSPLNLLDLTRGTADYAWYEPTSLPLPHGNNVTSVRLTFDGILDYANVFVNESLVATSLHAINSGIDGTIPVSPLRPHVSQKLSIFPPLRMQKRDEAGYPWGASSLTVTIKLSPASRPNVQVLAGRLGTSNYGPYYFENAFMGITRGATMSLLDAKNTSSVPIVGWRQAGFFPKIPPQSSFSSCTSHVAAMTWTKACVPLPPTYRVSASYGFGLVLSGMRKGQAFVNGRYIGRFFLLNAQYAPSQGTCMASCQGAEACEDRIGSFQPWTCLKGCGEPSQKVYKIPADVLNSSSSCDVHHAEVVLLEEIGGDTSDVRIVEVKSGFDMVQCDRKVSEVVDEM